MAEPTLALRSVSGQFRIVIAFCHHKASLLVGTVRKVGNIAAVACFKWCGVVERSVSRF